MVLECSDSVVVSLKMPPEHIWVRGEWEGGHRTGGGGERGRERWGTGRSRGSVGWGWAEGGDAGCPGCSQVVLQLNKWMKGGNLIRAGRPLIVLGWSSRWRLALWLSLERDRKRLASPPALFSARASRKRKERGERERKRRELLVGKSWRVKKQLNVISVAGDTAAESTRASAPLLLLSGCFSRLAGGAAAAATFEVKREQTTKEVEEEEDEEEE